MVTLLVLQLYKTVQTVRVSGFQKPWFLEACNLLSGCEQFHWLLLPIRVA